MRAQCRVRRQRLGHQVGPLRLDPLINVQAVVAVRPAIKPAVAHRGQIVGYQIAADLVALVGDGPQRTGHRLERHAVRVAQAGCEQALGAGIQIDLPDRGAALLLVEAVLADVAVGADRCVELAAIAAGDDVLSGLLSATKVRLSELFTPGVKRALLIGVVIAVFQQWCGINVIFNYAEEIFRAAGFDISNVVSNIAWAGSVNLVFTIVALNLVDSVGRKPLMLIGAAGLAAIYTAIGICFALGVTGFPVLLLVLAAIGCYGMTLAPVTWIVISEIFPTRLRGAAMSIAVGALWLACFALTYTFPLLNAKLGAAGVFYLYAIVCVAGFLFVWRFLREAKGKTLEQLERDLGAPQSREPLD